MTDDRAAREEKALQAVRSWLPELVTPGTSIQITAVDPDENDGALFAVGRSTSNLAYVCERWGRR